MAAVLHDALRGAMLLDETPNAVTMLSLDGSAGTQPWARNDAAGSDPSSPCSAAGQPPGTSANKDNVTAMVHHIDAGSANAGQCEAVRQHCNPDVEPGQFTAAAAQSLNEAKQPPADSDVLYQNLLSIDYYGMLRRRAASAMADEETSAAAGRHALNQANDVQMGGDKGRFSITWLRSQFFLSAIW